MYRVGLSTKGKVFDENLFKTYRDGGIYEMEISLPVSEFGNIEWEQVGAWQEKYGVHVWTVHLPFGGMDELSISSLDSSVIRHSLAYHDSIIKGAAGIGVRRFVIHSSAEPIEDKNRRAHLEIAKESLRHLADTAQTYGATLLVEELPRTCLGNSAEEMHELLSADPRLLMCFDTNHLGTADPVPFIREFQDKIRHIHVSDGMPEGEKHWLPGEGMNDWQAIYHTLCDIGFSGVWMYEVEFKAPASIMRPRDLNCADFLRNAEEIFENKPLTVLGKEI